MLEQLYKTISPSREIFDSFGRISNKKAHSLIDFVNKLKEENADSVGVEFFTQIYDHPYEADEKVRTIKSGFQLDTRHKWRQLIYPVRFDRTIDLTESTENIELTKLYHEKIIAAGNTLRYIKQEVPWIRIGLREQNGDLSSNDKYKRFIELSKSRIKRR